MKVRVWAHKSPIAGLGLFAARETLVSMLLHAAYAVLAEVGVMGGNGGEEQGALEVSRA